MILISCQAISSHPEISETGTEIMPFLLATQPRGHEGSTKCIKLILLYLYPIYERVVLNQIFDWEIILNLHNCKDTRI